MRTFISAIIALLVAISLGSGVLLVAAVGVCVGGGGSDIKIGVVVGIIGALVFSVWVFVIVFKSLDKSSHSNGEQGKLPRATALLPQPRPNNVNPTTTKNQE